MALFGRRKRAENAAETEPPETPETGVEEETGPTLPPVDADGRRSVDDHREFVLSLIDELPPFGQQILDALDLSLCEDVISQVDLPSFDHARVAGYAVQSADVEGAKDSDPVVLAVVGQVHPGQVSPTPLSPGTAMVLAAGAPIPDNADAVVALIDTDEGADDVLVYAEAPIGTNIRRRGEDLAAGTQVFRTGERLGPGGIGLLAAIGHDKALVRPRPRVVVVSAGSDLVEPGAALGQPGQSYDAASRLVSAAARHAGAVVYQVSAPTDEALPVTQAILDQLVRADLLVMVDRSGSLGSASSAEIGVLRRVLGNLGWSNIAEIAMTPGGTHGVGLIGADETPVLLIPGDPQATRAAFEAFIRPVIRKLRGVTPVVREASGAVVRSDISSVQGMREFVPGVVERTDDQRRVTVAATFAEAIGQTNALILLDEETDRVNGGDIVPVWLLDED